MARGQSLYDWTKENNKEYLLEEWNDEKNDITPKDKTYGSEKKVWWKCNACGNEWNTYIYARTRGNNNCPECALSKNRKWGTSYVEQYIYNALKSKFKEVENRSKINGYEYDIYIRDVNLLIEYDGYYYHKILSNKSEIELKKKKAALSNNFDFIRIQSENKKIKKIKIDNNVIKYRNTGKVKEYNAVVHLIIEYINNKYKMDIEKNVPKNIMKKTIEATVVKHGKNSIAQTHPQIADEWNYKKNGTLEPPNFTKGSNVKVWWKCKLGHEWKAIISQRTGGQNCPYCSNQRVLKGFNDLTTTHPEVAKQWHTTKNKTLPEEVTYGTAKKFWWKCKKGHSYKTKISSVINGCSCPYCNNRKILKGYNDLATTHPNLANEWHPTKNKLKSTEVGYNDKRKFWWECKKGHVFETKIAGKKRMVKGCPYCSGYKTWPGYNDFATTHPEIAKEWHPTKNELKPTEIKSTSKKTVWWKCKKGHEWKACVYSRSRGFGNCPKCNNEKTSYWESKYPKALLYRGLKSKVKEIEREVKKGECKYDIFISSLNMVIDHNEYSYRNYLKKQENAKKIGLDYLKIKRINDVYVTKNKDNLMYYEFTTNDVKGYKELFKKVVKYINDTKKIWINDILPEDIHRQVLETIAFSK